MICPDCNGSGKVIANHVTYADGRSGFGVECQCSRCQGTGSVPDEMAEWIEQGRAMRDARVNGKPYRSLWEEARRRGMTAQELSKMEFGKIKPILP